VGTFAMTTTDPLADLCSKRRLDWLARARISSPTRALRRGGHCNYMNYDDREATQPLCSILSHAFVASDSVTCQMPPSRVSVHARWSSPCTLEFPTNKQYVQTSIT